MKKAFTSLLPTLVLAASACLALPAAAQTTAAPMATSSALYDTFGGKPGLVKLMDDFMVRLLADPRTGRFFANADQERVKRQLTEQFCVILGGDCVYSGRDMRTTHAGLKIDRNNFNALVEDLQRAMDTHKVPFRAQNKLLAVLAPMHREAVTK